MRKIKRRCYHYSVEVDEEFKTYQTYFLTKGGSANHRYDLDDTLKDPREGEYTGMFIIRCITCKQEYRTSKHSQKHLPKWARRAMRAVLKSNKVKKQRISN